MMIEIHRRDKMTSDQLRQLATDAVSAQAQGLNHVAIEYWQRIRDEADRRIDQCKNAALDGKS
jgi:hypothetical protein